MVQLKYSLISAFTLFFIHCGSGSSEIQVLQQYASLNCSLQTLTKAKDSVLNKHYQPLIQKLSTLNNQVELLISKYEDQVAVLTAKKMEVDEHYIETYNKISRKHEESHGHLITVEYQKAIDKIERKKQLQFAKFDSVIEQLTRKKDSDTILKSTRMEMNEHSRIKKELETTIYSTYEVKIRDCQKQLEKLELHLRSNTEKLEGIKKRNYIQSIKKIREQPCKKLNSR